jgi:hypothetical protein
MAKLMISEQIVEKLERAAALRWVDDRDDPHKVNEIADERTALTAELTHLFGPTIRLLVESEILNVHVGEQDSFPELMVPINNVAVDDEFGITLDVEPAPKPLPVVGMDPQ